MSNKQQAEDVRGTIVLGIDPALGTTGYGVVHDLGGKQKVLDAGIVRVPRTASLEKRLLELSEGITEVLQEHRPNAVAVEELYSHYERPTTAILMGHARGVILLAASTLGLPVHSYAATKIKKMLTGNGRASKSQMQFAVQHQLGLQVVPEPADVSDALAVAVTHCHHMHAAHPQLGPHQARNPNLQALLKSK